MVKCHNCQENMKVIGTEKFREKDENVNNHNWKWFSGYMIYVVHYCEKCNIIALLEPKQVYG